jgi:hypothetical protein
MHAIRMLDGNLRVAAEPGSLEPSRRSCPAGVNTH